MKRIWKPLLVVATLGLVFLLTLQTNRPPDDVQLGLPGKPYCRLTWLYALLDQEVVNKDYPEGTYWEGRNTVTGTYDGQASSGAAYVELSGYVRPLSDAETDQWKC